MRPVWASRERAAPIARTIVFKFRRRRACFRFGDQWKLHADAVLVADEQTAESPGSALGRRSTSHFRDA
jgi:hypothetical protein